MSTRTRVLIADDHEVLRSMIRRALEAEGFEVVAEAADSEGAVDAALRTRPDLCLLDVVMPSSGIDAAERIHANLPDTLIVMLTGSIDEDDLFRSLRAGASGYLVKDTDPARLPAALRGVLSGEAAIPRTLVARLVVEYRETSRRRAPDARRRELGLSEREWEVLELLRAGHSTLEIATKLTLSGVTVRRHISSMVGKLGVEDRAAAVAFLDDIESGAA